MVISPNTFFEGKQSLFLVAVCHLQQASKILDLTAFLTDDWIIKLWEVFLTFLEFAQLVVDPYSRQKNFTF